MDRIKGVDAESLEMEVPESIRIGADRDGPIFPATPAPSVVAAYLANLGVSAALRAREVTGRGQWVETSLLQAAIQMSCATWQRPDNLDAPGYQMAVSDRRQTWGIVETAKGWICTWTGQPEWFAAAGAGDALALPDFQAMRGLTSIEDRMRSLAAAAPIFKKFPAEQWVEIAAQGGVCCQPVRSPEEALCDPALIAEGSVAEVEDPELGPLRQAGIVYRLHGCETALSGPAPKPGQHTQQVRAEASAVSPSVAVDGSAVQLAGPLDGIRVVDFGLAVAGPWSGELLADLGADVVKVDPLRQAFWMPTHMAIGVNRSKRWMGLDVKSADGTEVAHRLVKNADVVVMNMRPQAAEKLGLDFASLRAVNPRLIYCRTRGHEDGPRSLLPGNDQTGNALGGTEWEDGGCWNGGRPWFGATSNGDLGNGFLSAIAITQALFDREKSGEGQEVDASIVNAALFNNSRVYATPEGKGFERPKLDAEQLGFSALYRLYRCAEGWLCVAAVEDAHWRALVAAIPELEDDARFASAAGRQEHDDALAAVLAHIFRAETAKAIFERLDAVGVPCEISSETWSRELFDDEELLRKAWITRCEGNPVLGAIDMFGNGVDFSDTPTRPGGPPPIPWQDTRAVLSELGYAAEAIDALVEAGVAITPESAT